jgi:hypothetical protein
MDNPIRQTISTGKARRSRKHRFVPFVATGAGGAVTGGIAVFFARAGAEAGAGFVSGSGSFVSLSAPER